MRKTESTSLTCPICHAHGVTAGHILGHKGGLTTGITKTRPREHYVAAGKASAAARRKK